MTELKKELRQKRNEECECDEHEIISHAGLGPFIIGDKVEYVLPVYEGKYCTNCLKRVE